MMRTNLPLGKRPDDTRRANVNSDNSANQGLYCNKFFNQWNNDFTETNKDHSTGHGANKKTYYNGKMCWLLSQIHGAKQDNQQFETTVTASNANRKNGDDSRLKRAKGRISNLVKSLGGDTRQYTTTAPFVTGMGLAHPVENGFLWHHTLGVPYLPGSSIKGMIRAWAEHWQDDSDDARRIFGDNDDGAGNIIVFDALPVKPVELYVEVMTPHTDDWRIAKTPQTSPPADWVNPNPIPFLAIKEDAKFQFAMAARKGAEDDDLRKAFEYLENALAWIGAGAKTSSGFGRFESEEAKNARLKEIADEKVERQREIETLQANWVPAIGDVVKYTYGQGKHVVSKLDKNGDFYVTREDGSNEVLTDQSECSLWVED